MAYSPVNVVTRGASSRQGITLSQSDMRLARAVDRQIYQIGDETIIRIWREIGDFKHSPLLKVNWRAHIVDMKQYAEREGHNELTRQVSLLEESFSKIDVNLDKSIQIAQALNRDMAGLEARLNFSIQKGRKLIPGN